MNLKPPLWTGKIEMKITEEEFKKLMELSDSDHAVHSFIRNSEILLCEGRNEYEWAIGEVKKMRHNPFGGINIYDQVDVNVTMRCPIGSVGLVLQNFMDEINRKGCNWMKGSGMGVDYACSVQFVDKDKREKWDKEKAI